MDYIVCSRKRSMPKIRVDVCMSCRRMPACPDYRRYLQPSLFPEPATGKTGRRIRNKRVPPASSGSFHGSEQLALPLKSSE
ncbi:MAG: hypothetical protein JW821_17620 [Deltaproteobacteria bacterium]|nr:hypothetical protein [Deltaproteobacteria bacterium]